ncbi:MAG TPA: TIGR03435 family protein, partial [Verrucomicrobiae bacterium]|nr:TIGR03435 family protein [Verrucomicrobiae bacterium]
AFRAIPQTPANPALASWHIVATRYSFADLNQTLARQMDRVIVNETGMDGDFDFTMDFNLDPSQPNPLEPSILVAAMREQLGLTVKAQRGPVDYLVIDNVERDAAGN